jgi:hypothetical protein
MKPSHVLLVVGGVAVFALYLLTRGDVRAPGGVIGAQVFSPVRLPSGGALAYFETTPRGGFLS